MNMKKLFCVLGLVTASLLFAQPKASWVPAHADFVFVGKENPEKIVASYNQRLQLAKAEGLDIDALREDSYDEMPDGIEKVVALATSDSPTSKISTAESYVIAVTLPNDLKQLSKNSPAALREVAVYIYVENSKLNAPALAQAVAEVAQRDADDVKLSKRGAWTVLTEILDAEDAAERELPAMLAYREMPGGTVWVVGMDPKMMDQADLHLEGKAPALAPTSPLQRAFAPEILNPSASAMAMGIPSLINLFNRCIEQADFQRLTFQAPMLSKTSAIMVKGFADPSDKVTMELTIDLENAKLAEELRDLCLGYKVIGAMALGGNPDLASTIKMLSALKVTAEGAQVKITLTMTPQEVLRWVKEMSTVAERTDEADTFDFDDDLDDDFDDDDRFPGMTDDEARSILDTL